MSRLTESPRHTVSRPRNSKRSCWGVAFRTLVLVLVVGIVFGAAPPEAHATPMGLRALHVAASKKGALYRYGADGPYHFDCSGLVRYAFRRVGKRLPRTAAGQYGRALHIPAAARQAGDLVFFHSGRAVYHVGIYAGKSRVWHSPRPGGRVRLERIWTTQVWYGRIR
ncbi:C40 family peptidase [Streptomyces olivoreticuli]|uniref:C40 family peptidase n=1 Tax=Streptomyces olivoreticuli TaxID=68246 RepID=UPI000E22280D|nr:C40 family peptidase [Streptomyces olivoreticuli]